MCSRVEGKELYPRISTEETANPWVTSGPGSILELGLESSGYISVMTQLTYL